MKAANSTCTWCNFSLNSHFIVGICFYLFASVSVIGTADAAEVIEKVPKTLAILPFENNSVTDPEKYAPLSKGVAAMLITDLNRAGTSIKLIERTKIQTLLKEVALGQSGALDHSTAIQVGKILGAQSIAFGSFMVLENTVRMDLRIIKVETSEVIMAENVIGEKSSFITLVQDLAHQIALSLESAFSPEAASGKSDINAALYFSKGVEALDIGDGDSAQKLFEKAIAIDPSYQQQVDNLGVTSQ